MGEVAKIPEKQKTGLELIRTPFPEHQVGHLPKPTRAQTEALKKDIRVGRRCTICGGWHHPEVVHLDYVGHAAITDRLLDVDLLWQWEPFAVNQETGLPVIDACGGMWIRLTVCGHTRIGYGHADGKTGPDAIKETIGDAIRNAAMRFGAALELWHKGELHKPEPQDEPETPQPEQTKKQLITDSRLNNAIKKINAGDYSVQLLNANFELTPEQTERVQSECVIDGGEK